MTPAEVRELIAFARGYGMTEPPDLTPWMGLRDLEADEAQSAVVAHYNEADGDATPDIVRRRCRMAGPMPGVVPVPEPPAAPRDWRTRWQQAVRQGQDDCRESRASVLRHPDIAERLTAEPLDYARPEQWNGFIPPELFNGERNRSGRRDALLALVADAREADRQAAEKAVRAAAQGDAA